MPNKIITVQQAAEFALKLAKQQISEMQQEGMSKKQIQAVLNAAFGGLMYGH